MEDLFYIKIFTAHHTVNHNQLCIPNRVLGEERSQGIQSEASPGSRYGPVFLEASCSFSLSHWLSSPLRTSTSSRSARKRCQSESARSLTVRLGLATCGNERPGMYNSQSALKN